MSKINNETKIRRSTKLIIIEKIKVINYKNIEKVRAKRVVKEEATAANKNRNRTRKNTALESKIQIT